MALTPEEAAAIVARAAALDSEPLHDDEGLSEGVLREAALEVGLSEDPGTLASVWQQAGRAGRSGGESLVVFVARDPCVENL